MKKKLYIVTCVNDEVTCVSANAFPTFEGACAELKKQYDAEREDAISCGWGEDEFEVDEFNEDSAYLVYGSSTYYWEILVDEVEDNFTERAQELNDRYAEFDDEDEEETEMLLEDAMNLIAELTDKSRVVVG